MQSKNANFSIIICIIIMYAARSAQLGTIIIIIVQPHLTLNDYHAFLLWNYSQVGSFLQWSLREGIYTLFNVCVAVRSLCTERSSEMWKIPDLFGISRGYRSALVHSVAKCVLQKQVGLEIYTTFTFVYARENGQVVPPFAVGATLP